MKRSGWLRLGFCLLCGVPGAALAGGFQIGEMSSRATGMRAMVGAAGIIVPGTDYTPNAATISLPGFPPQAPTRSKSQSFLVPHAYYTY
jgi:hypothetical protein